MVTGPGGRLTINSDGTFSYTHDDSENFTDSFTYQVRDEADSHATATVTITINPVNDNDPIPPRSFTLDEGATATQADLDAGATLLDGDTDEDTGDTLTIDTTPVSGPSGSLTLNADGTFSYTHDDSENLSDSFTYQVRDEADHLATATVTITINPVNDNDPVADPESFTLDEGATATQADLDAGSSLLDGDTDTDLPDDTLTVDAIPVAAPAHGSLTTQLERHLLLRSRRQRELHRFLHLPRPRRGRSHLHRHRHHHHQPGQRQHTRRRCRELHPRRRRHRHPRRPRRRRHPARRRHRRRHRRHADHRHHAGHSALPRQPHAQRRRHLLLHPRRLGKSHRFVHLPGPRRGRPHRHRDRHHHHQPGQRQQPDPSRRQHRSR